MEYKKNEESINTPSEVQGRVTRSAPASTS